MRVVCGGEKWYSYAEYFGDDYSPYDRWINMELIYAGERVILNYDGKQFVYSGANISADAETIDMKKPIRLPVQWRQLTALAR